MNTTDTTTRVLYISDAPDFVQGLPVGTVIVHLRTDPPHSYPQAAERTADGPWAASGTRGVYNLTDAEIVGFWAPLDDADRAARRYGRRPGAPLHRRGHPRFCDHFTAGDFTSSADYVDPSFVYGHSPAGRLMAYIRRWVPTEDDTAPDVYQWAPITHHAPPMPDPVADRLMSGWTAARLTA